MNLFTENHSILLGVYIRKIILSKSHFTVLLLLIIFLYQRLFLHSLELFNIFLLLLSFLNTNAYINQLSARMLAPGTLFDFQELSIMNNSNLLTLWNPQITALKNFKVPLLFSWPCQKNNLFLAIWSRVYLLNQIKFISE